MDPTKIILDSGNWKDFKAKLSKLEPKEKKSLLPLVIQQAEIESRCLVSVTPTPPFYAVMTAQLERYVVRSRRGTNPHDVYSRTVCINGISINPPAYCNTSLSCADKKIMLGSWEPHAKRGHLGGDVGH